MPDFRQLNAWLSSPALGSVRSRTKARGGGQNVPIQPSLADAQRAYSDNFAHFRAACPLHKKRLFPWLQSVYERHLTQPQ